MKISKLFGYIALAATLIGWQSASVHAERATGASILVTIMSDNAPDADQDGLSDSVEAALGTDPNLPDTDGDGMPDGYKVKHGFDPHDPAEAGRDADNDGLVNLDEYLQGTDPYKQDSDRDGFWDGFETAAGTDPKVGGDFPDSGIYGDVNADGVVNALDIQIVINGALGIPIPVPADVNNVDGINAIDLQLVINVALNK